MPSEVETLCQLLRQLLWEQAPANDVLQVRWLQQPIAKGGFGSGGANLTVVSAAGVAVSTTFTGFPRLTKSVLLQNLSDTKAIHYWFTTSPTPPANGYSNLPAATVLPLLFVRGDQLPAFTFVPDPTSTDAGLELTIFFYNPKKAPGPQHAPFPDP